MTPTVLVLGGSGMLGHKMFQVLSRTFPDARCTVRGNRRDWLAGRLGINSEEKILQGVDADDIGAIEGLLSSIKPDVVVNCIGTIKQRSGALDPVETITTNSLLPHRLARLLEKWDSRLIHISTDCVFSGMRGNYSESDKPDATDLYGRSKTLGEVSASRSLTIRTSIIGRELSNRTSLLEWFLAQTGRKVRGFAQAWWSGVTTNHLSGVVARIIAEQPQLHGLYHLSSGRISKYELLLHLRQAYDIDVEIERDDTFFCDRSLIGDLFAERAAYVFPGWPSLLTELVEDPTDYEGRSTHE